ncbi:uncharacterized protein [Dysidea avara]|uniref:uncharacterized protein isoform X2 n=1 Tax=Dysidea avara TaxID=196820 RepID=UPI0033319A55
MLKENSCQLVLMLLLISFGDSEQQGLNITDPPEDNIVCVRDEVNITCGYILSIPLSLTWIIGGVSYSPSEIMSSSIYHSPVVSNSEDTILTIYSVSEEMNETTIQCEIPVSPPVNSSNGTLIVMGPPTRPVIKVSERRLTSLVISWDTFSHTSCGDVTYNVTLSDETAELVEERTTTSNTISFTDLDNDTQYEVTVLAINNAGPGTVVTTNVTTLTPSVPSPPSDLVVNLKFVDYKPVVTITWDHPSLTHKMSKVEKYEVSVTDEDGTTNIYPVLPSTTTLYSNDEEYSIKLVVGKEYTVAVRSENSVGASEGVSTSFAVRWLQSASITLLPNNKGVSVSCDVTESSPSVMCYVTISCSTCKEVTPITSMAFTNHTTLIVSPEASYHISVQVVRTDVFEKLEEYTFAETVTVPKPAPQSNTGTSSSSDDNNTIIYIIVVVAAVVIVGVLVMIVSCVLCVLKRRRRKRLVTSHYETKISNGYNHTIPMSTTETIKDQTDYPDTSVVTVQYTKLDSSPDKSPGAYCEISKFNKQSNGSCSAETQEYSEVADIKKPNKESDSTEEDKLALTTTLTESTELEKSTKSEAYAVVDMKKKHNKTNYAELADFDDKRLTVMPVPVPPVNYSDVKIDSRQENSS